MKVIDDDDDDDFDDDERKKSEKNNFSSNDRSGHDDQNAYWIIKNGAILESLAFFFNYMDELQMKWNANEKVPRSKKSDELQMSGVYAYPEHDWWQFS